MPSLSGPALPELSGFMGMALATLMEVSREMQSRPLGQIEGKNFERLPDGEMPATPYGEGEADHNQWQLSG